MKITFKFILLYLFILLTTQLFGDNAEINRLSREIYIVHEQGRLLAIRYEKEKLKSFNNRTVQSCFKLMRELRVKEIALINQKNRYIKLQNQQIIIAKRDKFIKLKKRKREREKILRGHDISKLKGNIKVDIDLSQQKMFVYKGNNLLYTWLVSTARNGYITPRGNYKPYHLERMHYSKLYDNSPMPYSIFFKGGYAIHGTNSTKRLGRRASHGCVRLHPSNAKKLYQLVRSHGYGRTSIKIRS